MPCINLADLAEQSFGTSLEKLDDRRIYKLLVKLVQERSAACPLNNGKKKLYYISAEFLIGKLLSNNLINLGIYDEVKETLEKNGYIRRDPTKPRAIEILDDSFNLTRREMVQIPIVGHVAAGEPVLAQENIEDYYPVPTEYISSNKELFMLKVQGESMINAGILDGDYVIVEKQATAENGDMVVALIDDGATVKTFYREEGVIRLQPENDTMEPFILEDVTILGKVAAVMRFFR